MHKKSASRSTLFLMELMIVIFIFALCAAVCMRLFGAAYSMSSDSDALNHATAISKTAAGCYKAADGDLALWCRLMDASDPLAESAVQNGRAELYYDVAWQRTDAPCRDGFYLCIVQEDIVPKDVLPEDAAIESAHESVQNNVRAAKILVGHTDGTEIFQLSVKKAVLHAGGEVYAP